MQDSSTKADGKYSANVRVTKANATDWYVQLAQNQLQINTGKPYSVTFSAKASVSRTIRFVIQHGYSPWTVYFQQSVSLTTTWKQYSFSFTPNRSDNTVELVFNLASHTGNVWIDAISLK